MEVLEHPLADDLRREEGFRKIGDLAVGIEGRTEGKTRRERSDQRVGRAVPLPPVFGVFPYSFRCAPRTPPPDPAAAPGRTLRVPPRRRRGAASILLMPITRGPGNPSSRRRRSRSASERAPGSVHDRERHVRSPETLGHRPHHRPAEAGPGPVDSRGVQQDQLQPRAAGDAEDAAPGGLGLLVDRRQPFPDQTVQEGGLPGARQPDHRHEAGAVFGVFQRARFRRYGGHLTACGGTRVSAESGEAQFLPVGVRLTRRVREEYRVYSDRNATKSAAQRRG